METTTPPPPPAGEEYDGDEEDEEEERARGEIVWLNVGGRRFATTLTTLERAGSDSFLGRLLAYRRSRALRTTRDEKGALFLDRNPEVFAVVLDFLRTGTLTLPPHVTREQAAGEFAFLQIPMERELTAHPSLGDVCAGRVSFVSPRTLELFWRDQSHVFVTTHLRRLRTAVVLSIQASKPQDHIQFCSFCPPLDPAAAPPAPPPQQREPPPAPAVAIAAATPATTPRSRGGGADAQQQQTAKDWPCSGDTNVSFTVPLAVLSTAMFRLFLRAVAAELGREVGFAISFEHMYIAPTGAMGAGGVATVCASLSVDLALECNPFAPHAAETTAIRQLLERTCTGDCFKTTETTPRYF